MSRQRDDGGYRERERDRNGQVGGAYGNRLDRNSRNAARFESSNPLAAAVQNMVEPGARAGGMVFDPYDAVANGGGVGAMAGRTLAGLDAQRAVDDANALAGWYEAMAYPPPSPEEAYGLWGDDSANLGYGPGPGGGTRMGYEQAIMVDPRLGHLGMGASGRDPRLDTPYGRQMVRGMAPSPDYVNAQRVLGLNRIMGY